MNNAKQFKEYCYGVSVTPPPPSAQLSSTTLVKFEKSHGTLDEE
jgi:hypothetical protein